MRNRIALTLALVATGVTPAFAHFNMLFPQPASAKKGEAVTFTYQWGHPFEHQLFDAPMPDSLVVVAPDGRRSDLRSTLEKTTLPGEEGKSVAGYRFRFTPALRGDYLFILKTPPIWMEEEGEFFRDTVKVVLHVQAQKGWDAPAGEEFEIVPLTRPYGLQAGMVFAAQLESRSPTAPSAVPALTRPVEIERYNPRPPKELPADEQVTRTARADRNGTVIGTLTESGWWCLTAARSGRTQVHEGKDRPVLERTTLWIFVDETPAK